MLKLNLLSITALIIAALIAFVITELLIIKYNGTPVPVPSIPRDPQTYGTGRSLTYVVMGDSTAVSQGSDYNDGFAVASAKRLAEKFEVTTVNTAVSGATSEDVYKNQLKHAVGQKPDIVLIAVGANDATHFTNSSEIKHSMQLIISELTKANPEVKIVVTGSPAVDSASRFSVGAKQVMKLRTKQVNAVFNELIAMYDLVFAPIAEETRQAFLNDPTLLAEDKFHPNARGYDLWIPVINTAMDKAVSRMP